MPTLVIVRHAKSAYPAGVEDHDRPLAPRGVVDAKALGEWLRANVPLPDQVVVSSARRARGTWTVAAAAVGYIGAAGYDADSPGPLTIDPRAYDASAERLLEIVNELPARVRTAVLVAHMPGVADLVSLVAGTAEPVAYERFSLKYPTSGVAVLDVPTTWSSLTPGSGRLVTFAVPRGDAD